MVCTSFKGLPQKQCDYCADDNSRLTISFRREYTRIASSRGAIITSTRHFSMAWIQYAKQQLELPLEAAGFMQHKDIVGKHPYWTRLPEEGWPFQNAFFHTWRKAIPWLQSAVDLFTIFFSAMTKCENKMTHWDDHTWYYFLFHSWKWRRYYHRVDP